MNYEETLEQNAKLLEENAALCNRVKELEEAQIEKVVSESFDLTNKQQIKILLARIKELEDGLAGAIADCNEFQVDSEHYRKLKAIKRDLFHRQEFVEGAGVYMDVWTIAGIERESLEDAIDAAAREIA